MNKKLLAGLAAVSFLAGGGGTTALAAAGASPAAASTAAVASSTSGHGHGPLGSLVANGTITKAQAIAIHNALVAWVRGHWRNTLDTVLGPLVKNHTITQSQASAVITAFSQRM
jgi:hypothetical protein